MHYEESLDNVGLFEYQREVKHPKKDYIISRQPQAPGCYVQCCMRILPPHCTAPPSPWQSPALRPPASDEKMRKSIKSPLATVCRAECIQIFTGRRVGNTSRKKPFWMTSILYTRKNTNILFRHLQRHFIEERVCESTFHESMYRCPWMTRNDQAPCLRCLPPDKCADLSLRCLSMIFCNQSFKVI